MGKSGLIYNQCANSFVDAITQVKANGLDCAWEDYFEDEKIHFTHSKIEAAKRAYWLSSFITGIIILLLSGNLYINANLLNSLYFNLPKSPLEIISIGLFGGTLGALVTILLRATKLHPSQSESVSIFKLYGMTRLILGSLFGLIGACFQQTDYIQLFGTSESFWPLFLSSVAFGFSENFVPEFLASHTNNNNQTEEKKAAPKDT